ncbi:MAG: serine/threonine protein kinase [Parashewanella sp.]
MSLYEIFTKAITLPTDSRKKFIHDSCNGDQELIDEVNKLIESDLNSQANSNDDWTKFLNTKIEESSELVTDFIGTTIGAFCIESKIGQGGMGDVYLASRSDKQFEQQVAIKVIDKRLEHVLGKDSLIREAAFMAKLNHPNIGKVYDAGITDDGYSFIIMEFVKGKSFLDAIKKEGVNTNLNLFLQLCSAVHYAHQMQVIHADLKPSNIIVEDSNQLKVLDFGVARMFNSHAEELTLSYTGYVRALTSNYSSPEVLNGDLPNVLSDVYSLGMILKDLINSSQLTQSQIKELSAIYKMATRNTKDRYQSVLELRNDIVAYQKGYVTKANDLGALHSVKKFFFARHPISSFIGSSILALTIYLVANLFFQHQALKIANAESALVISKFRQLLELADLKKTNGKSISAKDLLNNAQELVEEDKVLGKDSIAVLKVTLAHSFESIGDIKKASELYKSVVLSVDNLKSKSIAFQAGANLVEIYLYSNQFAKIQKDTSILVDKIKLDYGKRVPANIDEALFYHKYLNGVKYYLYQSMPSAMGQEHVELLRRIKKEYWSELDENKKGNILGALGGAIMNQLPIGIEFTFEQVEPEVFSTQYIPLFNEAITSLQQSIEYYRKQNNQIEVLKKQIVVGRAFIELDNFREGKKQMESALSLHQKIVGSTHPNNIQFYRMMAGFYSFDSPTQSLERARQGVELAFSSSQVNQVQRLHAQEVLLFSLYNAGLLTEYQATAQSMFETYLLLPEDTRNQQTLLVIAKTLKEYISRLGWVPRKSALVAKRIKKDHLLFVAGQDVLPDRVNELFSNGFLKLLEVVEFERASKEAFVEFLVAETQNSAKTSRERYFSDKSALDAIELSLTAKMTLEQQAPSFPWGKKEIKQSVNRLDAVLKQVNILIHQRKIKQAAELLNSVNSIIELRRDISDSIWPVLFDAKAIEIELLQKNKQVSLDDLNLAISKIKDHYPDNSWLIKE